MRATTEHSAPNRYEQIVTRAVLRNRSTSATNVRLSHVDLRAAADDLGFGLHNVGDVAYTLRFRPLPPSLREMGFIDVEARGRGLIELVYVGDERAEAARVSALLSSPMADVSEPLIRLLAARPQLVHQLDPIAFEEIVAELYRRKGCTVTLTPRSGDEGVDLYVVPPDSIGTTLWIVQAKRWAADRRIGAAVVRELCGTVELQGASAGVLVTTSHFQPGAHKIAEQRPYRVTLRDFVGLCDMFQEAVGRRRPVLSRPALPH